MIRDTIVARADFISASVTYPIILGALRAPDLPTTWIDDARTALVRGSRVVISGNIEDVNNLASEIRQLANEFTAPRFALLIHWTQALASVLSDDDIGIFETVYVAVDSPIASTLLRLIEARWQACWVLIPTLEIDWHKWIPTSLLPKKQGTVILLAPDENSEFYKNAFLSCDELHLNISEFSDLHPLIQIRPAPAEWHLRAELGPWKIRARDASRSSRLYTAVSHDQRLIDVSIVIPFRYAGSDAAGADLQRLKACIASLEESVVNKESVELIVAVDRDSDAATLTEHQLTTSFENFSIVENSREADVTDWRAGFIRNCGANVSQSEKYLVFVDSDIVIAKPEATSAVFAQLASSSDAQLMLLGQEDVSSGFQTATSAFLVIEKNLFKQCGGFVDAFSTYGCEDNFLVWQAQQLGARTQTLPADTVRHLRDKTESDDLAVKMLRIRKSASLMYRLTLSAEVHRHFFSCLGSHLWLRALLKRAAANVFARTFLGIFIFIITLIEAQSRRSYLQGFYDVIVWKLKRPLLWIVSQRRQMLPVRMFYRGGHWLKSNAWRVPHFFRNTVAQTKHVGFTISGFLKIIWIKLCAARFGLNAVGWRISVVSLRLRGQLRRFAGWLRTQVGPIAQELWIFKQPTAWFESRTPLFYRMVWRPLLKVRYFIEYHFVKRWRSS